MGNRLKRSQGNEDTNDNKSIDTLVKQQIWVISKYGRDADFKVYTESKWKHALPEIESSEVKKVKCSNAKAPDFIFKICHIQFSQLKQLVLNNNWIISLEAFSKLNAPLLQQLQISFNKITSIRSLRKLYCPRLHTLTFIEDMIVQGNAMTQLTCASSFKDLTMFCPNSKILPGCYNWVFKMQPSELGHFQYYNTQIIRNHKYRDMFKQKYVQAGIVLRYDSVQ